MTLAGKEGKTASGSVSTALRVVPGKRARSVQSLLTGSDPVGNEVSDRAVAGASTPGKRLENGGSCLDSGSDMRIVVPSVVAALTIAVDAAATTARARRRANMAADELGKDVTDVSTNRVGRLASIGVAAALLLLLAPTAGSTARDASAEAQKRCPKGSVAAVIGGERSLPEGGANVQARARPSVPPLRLPLPYRPPRAIQGGPPVYSRKVDVGGYRLAITCLERVADRRPRERGRLRGDSAWYLLQPRLAKTTRVCSYDRAGLEASDDRRPPGPVPAAKVVEELHSLLAGAGISPPYVLGGWSLGGFFNRLYAKRYPAEVAGLVGVDGTPIGLPGKEW